MAWRWSFRLAAGLLGGLVLLTGCSEEQPANESLPTSTASPTEEELPPLGPDDLPMPAEARTQDAAGAEAFVRYYIALINRTSEVMDAEPLREFSDGCEDCERISTTVEKDAAAGYSYEGGGISLTAFGDPRIQGETAQVTLAADLAALSVVDQSGVPVPDAGAPAYPGLTGGAAVQWDIERSVWVMTDLTLR